MQYFSAITVKTCSNFVCLSSEATKAPLLPHKNLRWNSVLKINRILKSIGIHKKYNKLSSYLNDSSKRSSNLLWSAKIVCAFLLYKGKFLINALAESKCENKIPKPKSCALDSHDDIDDVNSEEFDGTNPN